MSEDLFYSVDRDERVKDTAEVFTPNWLVENMLDELNVDWSKPPLDEKFIDPTCGSGNFLVALAKRGIPLNMIYGVDIMDDNILTTKKRLTECFQDNMGIESINYHLNRNIIRADARTYHYEFWWWKDPSKITDVIF